jgi:hypothetical protein
LQVFVHDFPWIHMGIGLTGNTLFFVGSAFFLIPPLETAALWMFAIGSFGVLLGSVGEILVRRERRVRERGSGQQAQGREADARSGA